MTTAKNRALDVLRRERTARTFAPELTRLLDIGMDAGPDARRAVRSARDQGRRAADDVLLLRSAPRRSRRRLRWCSTSSAASASTRSRAPSSPRTRRSRSGSPAPRRSWRQSAAALRHRRTPRVRRAPSVGPARRSTCSSTRATTARPPSSPVRAELCREAMRLAALLRRAPAGATAGDGRARGADVPQRGAASGPHRRGGRPARAERSGSLQVGSRPCCARVNSCCERSAPGAGAHAPIMSRRPSPGCTPPPRAPRTPTGRGSSRSTTC